MISVFDVEKLQLLLKDFYRITNIRITVFDTELSELVSYPESCTPFCSLIRSTTEGRAACADCDRQACAVASKQKTAHIYRCHAGLTEAIMPLWLGDTLVGYLMFGHVFDYSGIAEGWETIKECCKSYPLDLEKLKSTLPDCPHATAEYIDSAAHILHATASFLVLERMATLREDSIAAKLDSYLSDNYNEQLTSQSICSALGIGRSKLYKLCSQLYGCGYAEHIRDLRMETAKHLLIDCPDMSITAIAEQCGYTDYNYFIAVFSKQCGVSPGVFRNSSRHR